MNGRRILVVDDNQDAALTLALVLELEGHDVRVSHSGEEAVLQASTFRPDIIFMDIALPNIDGWQAAREIRSRPWGRDITILALSGYSAPEDRQRSAEAGMDGHLVKPIDPLDLVRIIPH
ncbi:MAG: response regulator [Pseudomonadota bacterium]|jgi:Response regulators consisting of a CheY-like receiver domain and a winged-helix DNA-binding domain|nr:MAG: hypothetical protein DIU56_05180 [Pseudomonadota bacterium]